MRAKAFFFIGAVLVFLGGSFDKYPSAVNEASLVVGIVLLLFFALLNKEQIAKMF